MVGISKEELEQREREAGRVLAHAPPGEEVVITGCSGRFPDSDDVHQLRDNLYAKQDLISADTRRWNLQHDEIPHRTGKVNFVSKFDAAFFGYHYKQAHTMDPMCRMLLERTYEAIIDAGINPKKLQGTKCGVFIGSCFSESEKTWFYERMNINGFGVLGSSRAMLSNRISFWLGIHGPSYTVDSACSSSLYAVEHAYKAMRDGICDSAIVGGCNLCLHPYVSLQFSRLGVLSPDGRCKAFDQSANGYCRAEAITVLFLQKAKDAKRVYATIVHAKTNCDGYKEQGITYPSGHMQRQLLEDFYKECDINPNTLAYIEAHGTGTKVGDPEECNALDKVFCNGREGPLLIGSVKSNLGHTEPASGICSMIKVIIAMENMKIPPNLWFTTPKEGIPGFLENRLQVVSETTPWSGGLAGVNSFGFGGANCHVLMKWNDKSKVNNGLPGPGDTLPRLINISGRTEEAVDVLLDDLEKRSIDVEYVKLLHDIHADNIPGHIYRGFIVISNDRKIRDVQYFSGKKKPVYLIFSGLGSQWPAMGKALLKIGVFATAVERCAAILRPLGVDLMKIITSEDAKTLENIVNKLVGIVAVQIGLVDILHTLGIHADYMIGHSIGELGCSYADGSLTAEQTILAAYYRGKVIAQTDFVRGGMAAVGMGYKKIKSLLPPEIEVACRNGADACTITGPLDSLRGFITSLVVNGVFVKEVSCGNIPYHSRYMAKAAPKLLAQLQKVIPAPKVRSPKWITTSVPEGNQHLPYTKLSSAEYHTNNFISPVLFEEAIANIPAEAVTIEVAPHGLLQPILRRALSKLTSNVALTQRGHADNAQVLLTGIGKLYELGIEPQLSNLYPPVAYPVSRGTPMISPLVKWDHRDDWFLTSYRMQEKIQSGERTVRVTLEDEDWAFVSGHVIDGRNLFPATGYILLVWETLSMMRGELYLNTPVVLENIKFNRATTIPKGGMVEFTVMVQKGSGAFEVLEGGVAVVTGRIYKPENMESETMPLPEPQVAHGEDILPLNTRDIYKELRLRGYNYSGMFRGLQEVDLDGHVGKVAWRENWVAFMDNILQIQILHEDTRGLYVPTSIQKVVIDPRNHVIQDPESDNPYVMVHAYEEISVIKAGGIEIRDLKAQQIPRRKPLGDPVLEKYLFTPHYVAQQDMDLLSAVRVCLHLALENLHGIKVKVIELGDDALSEESPLIAPLVAKVLGDLPLVQAEILVLSNPENARTKELGHGITVDDRKLSGEQNCLAVVGASLLARPDVLQQAWGTLREGGFVIARELADVVNPHEHGFNVLVDYVIGEERILLLTQTKEQPEPKVLSISAAEDFSWLPTLKEMMKEPQVGEGGIIVVSQNEPTSGLMGFINCLNREPEGNKVRAVLIMDKNAPPFSLENPLYKDHLAKGLFVNVFQDGQWGTYRHQALPSVITVRRSHGYINNAVRGDLSSLKFFEGPFNVRLSSGEIVLDDLIDVYYCSINFRDIMLASGKLSTDVVARGRMEQEIVIGFEFAGRLSSGKRVMGMLSGGSMGSFVPAKRSLVWEVPDQWSLAEAATVPVVYGTVRSALLMNGRLKKGDTILIHAGTGGVGLAAIVTSLQAGATVFTTVGTQEKREYMRQHFPEIPESHIGNSRDTSFEHMIKRETNGRGVDLVLNSLAEEKLTASIRCLAKGGRFIEIGKFDIANNNPIGMEMFSDDQSFHAVMLDLLFDGPQDRSDEVLNMVHKAIPLLKPLKYTVFPVDQVEQAFRHMAAGKHIGKVILQLREEEEDRNAKPEPLLYDVVPRFYASATRTYIVTGGLGGFGLELADWLALRGARNIVLTSRKGLRTGYQALRIRLWRGYGCKVLISTDDITTEEGVTELLNKANAMGTVAAIFNLAVVLRDALIENQTEEDFKISFGPKAVATIHLDKLSRTLCPQLEHFVIFSSVSCGRGNAGQTNYGMANSVMERVCEQRRAAGLPGLAVQWGAIGEVGLVAEMQEEHVELVIGGTLQQSISSCLSCMDTFLKQDHPVVASMVVAEKRAGGSGAGNIVDTVIGIMGIKDLKTVSLHSSLAELGMDSMMAVEIKQTLEREFEVFLTAQDIRGLTFAKLQELDAKGQVSESAVVVGDSDTRITHGIGFLLRLVQDESIAHQNVITVRSPESGPCDTQNPVFLIPGMEGMAKIFENLGPLLSAPAHCLQFPYKKPAESMKHVANMMLPDLLNLRHDGHPVTIIGYSTGAMVALELTWLLEAAGIKVKLILLDGAPDFLLFLTKAMNIGETDDDLQNAVILAVYNVLVPGTGEDVKEGLKKIAEWDAKLAYAKSLVPEKATIHSPEHQSALMIDIYHRMRNVMEYKVTSPNKIKAPVTLIRPLEQTVPDYIDEDYNLSRICQRKVDIVFVEGNHLSMLDNAHLAELINNVHKSAMVDSGVGMKPSEVERTILAHTIPDETKTV